MSNIEKKEEEAVGIVEGLLVLCGANSYDEKYYYNPVFSKIPQSIQEELRVLCILFTEEVGGILTISFEVDGTIMLATNVEEDDIYYDEISSGLMIREVRQKRQELFESLRMYYRIFILKEELKIEEV